MVNLEPLEREGLLEIWDDTKINPGQKWKQEIEDALNTAKIAVLLISADFLASEFITLVELPSLLKAQKDNGVIILPVILSPCRYIQTPILRDLKPMNSPDNTYMEMDEAEKARLWVSLTDIIMEHLGKKNG